MRGLCAVWLCAGLVAGCRVYNVCKVVRVRVQLVFTPVKHESIVCTHHHTFDGVQYTYIHLPTMYLYLCKIIVGIH